jgi:hypothetical protein
VPLWLIVISTLVVVRVGLTPVQSVFSTCKDLLTLERHGARTPRNLFVRIALRLLALAACISLNHQLGRPSRAIATYTT